MPKASRSSTTSPTRTLRHDLMGARAAAVLQQREAEAHIAAIVLGRLHLVPLTLPQDHPDTALESRCVTLEILREMVDALGTAGSIAAGDDWLEGAVVACWEDAARAVADLPATTLEGLRRKVAAARPSVLSDMRMDRHSTEPGNLREMLFLPLIQEVETLIRFAHLPIPHAVKVQAEVEAGEHRGIRVGNRVAFSTTGRGGETPERPGTVRRIYRNTKGYFFQVEDASGSILNIRPRCIRAA